MAFGWAIALPPVCFAQTKEAAVEEAKTTDGPRPGSASLLPDSTRFWVAVEDLDKLDANIAATQIGQLAQRDSLKPFFSSFEKQIRESLDRNGVKFGIDLEGVQKLVTGEIAIAGVLPDFQDGAKPVRGSHGVVVLIDVAPGPDEAAEFIKAATKKMLDKDAKQEKLEINGTSVSKWTIKVPNPRVKNVQNSWVALVDNWILASDNEAIFRGVLSRIKSKKKASGANLGGSVAFKTIEEQTRVEGVKPDLRWYVDPIGYARLADALAEEKKGVRELKDRPLEVLGKEGLDALKAVGGFVSFSTKEHDMLHRTLVFTEKGKALDATRKRLLSLLDFAPVGHDVESVPKWVPANVGSYFAATWDVQKAWTGIGHFVDVLGEPGTMKSVLESMKESPKFRVDLNKMVAAFGKRATVVTATTEPVSESSEKMLIGIELADGVDSDWLIESMGRAVSGKVKDLGGFKCVVDDRTETEEEPGIDIDIDEFEEDLEDDQDEDEFEDEELEDELEDDPAKPKPMVTLFNRRFYVIKGNTLFICNDKDYLKKILFAKASDAFVKSATVEQMKNALAKLTDAKNVRFRMYTHLDRILKTNYEMMRLGRMAESETFIARLLNQLYGKKARPDEKREQQIDGSKLPADFEKEIGPYLGLSGWAMEVTDSGWRFSGCVLPREKTKAKEDK